MSSSLVPDPSDYTGQPSNYSFGPFTLHLAERRLQVRGERVRLGGKALEILLALCQRAGALVTKEELLHQIWAEQQVDEGTLRVHISELRKVLSEAGDGGRFVVNVPGKGYVFVAPLTTEQGHRLSPEMKHTPAPEGSLTIATSPPALLTRPVGRADEIRKITDQLRSSRFVNIVGTGGVGKTTVALAVAEALRDDFDGKTVFVDLSRLTDASGVHAAFATSLGLPVREDQEFAAIAKVLAKRDVLLMVDNCEHVAEEVAGLLQNIRAAAPDVLILATSREPLHVAGERVHRLPQLSLPPERVTTAEEARQFASVELFVERAYALDSEFELSDENANTVATICRSLDGLALAIEFAASRVSVLGTEPTAGYFSRLDSLNKGMRTALPRHQTLRRTLDWSYNLLSQEERDVLCRLGVFAGSFSLKAAQFVVGPTLNSTFSVANCIADLVDKSLISLDTGSDPIRFKLLNTTRDYVVERLSASPNLEGLNRQHALYYLRKLEGYRQGNPDQTLAPLRRELENVRAALEFSFSENGDPDVAIQLALAAGPLFWDLALLAEGARWATCALATLQGSEVGTRVELELRVNSSLSLLFTHGNFSEVEREIRQTMRLARNLAKPEIEERVLSAHFAFNLRGGNVPGMIEIAEDARILAQTHGPSFNGASDSMTGTALAFLGSVDAAIPFVERALAVLPISRPMDLLRTGVDQRIWSANALAQLLWMKGEFTRSKGVAIETIAEARSTGNAALESIALIWMLPVLFWANDVELAEIYVDRLSDSAMRSGIVPFRVAAEANQGILEVCQGSLDSGLLAIEGAIAKLRGFNSRMLELVYTGYLTDAYGSKDDVVKALASAERALMLARETGANIYTAELLRKKALFQWRQAGRLPEFLSAIEEGLALSRAQGNPFAEMKLLLEIVSLVDVAADLRASSLGELQRIYSALERRGDVPEMRIAGALLSNAPMALHLG